MKKQKLRPIGNIFKKEYPPSICSTETQWKRITYKVIAHVKAQIDFVGNAKFMEEIEVIDIEYFDKPCVYKMVNGFITIT